MFAPSRFANGTCAQLRALLYLLKLRLLRCSEDCSGVGILPMLRCVRRAWKVYPHRTEAAERATLCRALLQVEQLRAGTLRLKVAQGSPYLEETRTTLLRRLLRHPSNSSRS